MTKPTPKLQITFFVLLCSALLAGAPRVFAGMGTSLMQTATILDPGKMEAKLQNDLVLSGPGSKAPGFNISPHLSVGLVEHYLELDSWVGTGTTDFQLGTMGKYNILPDMEGQAALSLLAGLSIIRDAGESSVLTSFGFVASKKTQFSIAETQATPYAALQVEALIDSNNSPAPISLAVGSKWEAANMKWVFYTELGINVHQSLWMIAAGVGHPF